MKRLTTLWLASLACLLWTAGTATAQSSLKSLGLQLGERLEITDTTGKKITGKLDSITSALLTVREGKTILALKESDIAQIRHRKPEKWWDGMAFGIAGGVAVGVASTASMCTNDSECAAAAGAILVPTFAAAGAGIGALIDRLHHKNETVFDRNSSSALRRLYFSPDVGKDRKAVRVSFRF